MKNTNQYQDAQWLEELSKDSSEAFRCIYNAYQKPLFAFAFYLTKSADIAGEVVHEVFIKLWMKRSRFPPDLSLLPYLRKATQNLVFDLFKKANRDRRLQQQLYQAMAEACQQGSDTLREKELYRIYYEGIQNLPPQQKLIYCLHRDQDLTYQEIAGRLGLSRNTIRNHMTEAIRSIRIHVEKHTDLACLLLVLCTGEIGR